MGPFVDNVTVSWDDDQRDMTCQAPVFFKILDRLDDRGPARGRTSATWSIARFGFTTCNGGIPRYPAFTVTALAERHAEGVRFDV